MSHPKMIQEHVLFHPATLATILMQLTMEEIPSPTYKPNCQIYHVKKSDHPNQKGQKELNYVNPSKRARRTKNIGTSTTHEYLCPCLGA